MGLCLCLAWNVTQQLQAMGKSIFMFFSVCVCVDPTSMPYQLPLHIKQLGGHPVQYRSLQTMLTQLVYSNHNGYIHLLPESKCF